MDAMATANGLETRTHLDADDVNGHFLQTAAVAVLAGGAAGTALGVAVLGVVGAGYAVGYGVGYAAGAASGGGTKIAPGT